MQAQETSQSSFITVRLRLMEGNFLSAEKSVLLLHSSAILKDGSRAIEMPLVQNYLTRHDVEDGL